MSSEQRAMTDFRPELGLTRLDHATAALKGAVGAVPLAGGLLAEMVGAVIPNQRLDRIASFAMILDAKLATLDRDVVEQRMRTEEFADLLEDGLRQASRSLSDERRRYIASVLKNSLASDELKHLETKRMLELLGELNDLEIIILESENGFYAAADPFRQVHKEALSHPYESARSTAEARDKVAVYESYRAKLRRLDLLRPEYEMPRDRTGPQFDHRTGTLLARRDRVTDLGSLLLRVIDSDENIPHVLDSLSSGDES
jgi:outer membrane murein-binding lipoprotein Lpp